MTSFKKAKKNLKNISYSLLKTDNEEFTECSQEDIANKVVLEKELKENSNKLLFNNKEIITSELVNNYNKAVNRKSFKTRLSAIDSNILNDQMSAHYKETSNNLETTINSNNLNTIFSNKTSKNKDFEENQELSNCKYKSRLDIIELHEKINRHNKYNNANQSYNKNNNDILSNNKLLPEYNFFSCYERNYLKLLNNYPFNYNAIKSITFELILSCKEDFKYDMDLNKSFIKDIILNSKLYNKDYSKYYYYANSNINLFSFTSYRKFNIHNRTEILNKDFITNSKNNNSNFTNPDYIKSNNYLLYWKYIEAMSDVFFKLYNKNISNCTNMKFYLVTLIFSVCFTSVNNSDFNNNLSFKKEGTIVGYISNYYSNLEQLLKSLNISYEKVTNNSIINNIKEKNFNKTEKTEINIEDIEDFSTLSNLDLENIKKTTNSETKITNINSSKQESNYTIIAVKGVNLILLFNYIINEFVDKEVSIYSNYPFNQSSIESNYVSLIKSNTYNENTISSNFKIYGCIFPSFFKEAMEDIRNKLLNNFKSYSYLKTSCINLSFYYLEKLNNFHILNSDLQGCVVKTSSYICKKEDNCKDNEINYVESVLFSN